MMGFSDRDFSQAQNVWMGRVHPDDQQSFVTFWKELESGEKRLTSDYRFFRNGRKQEVRVRDNSVSLRNSDGRIDTIISSYTDISDLTVKQEGEDTAGHLGGLIRPLLHEIQNSLHVIRMGVDFMSMDQNTPFGIESAVRGIECLNKLSEELHEYFVPIKAQVSAEQPEILLKHVVHCMEGELQRHGVSVRIAGEGPLPVVQLDRIQFRRALKHVIDFCQVLVAKGGDLEIEVRQKTIEAQAYVELTILSSSPRSLEVDENTAFQPFLRVNGIQIGLGMAIAQQILRRQQGNIVFRKKTSQQALISILLKVCSDKQGASEN
jgi:signal transduction histidine kinase